MCGNCGKENSVIGYEKSEQLDVKPAEYFVVVTMREKRACKPCEEQGAEECAPVYTLTLWSRLSRFLEYPELELSNYLAENAMRPVALGRRNWIQKSRGRTTSSRHDFNR